MKVVIDNIVFDLQKSGGISILWYELLSRLQQNKKFELYYSDNQPKKNYCRNQLTIDTNKIVRSDFWPRLQSYLPVTFNQDDNFIFHSSYYRYCTHPRAINITTVHDFTYEFFRKGIYRRLHSWQKFNAIRNSQYIVCISESTKRDLMRFLPDVDENKIRIIHNGVSEDYCILDQPSEKYKLPFPSSSYVVSIGNRASYKNFELCLKAVAQTDYNLVIFGCQINKKEKEEIERYLPPHRYSCVGYVTNQDLNILYNHAAALVYPSSYEGFGIPIIEAQRAGCPVIAYNTSSIPEVIGETPLLMEELTDTELVEKLHLLADSEVMKQVRDNGIVNSKRFSWDKAIGEYLDLYEEALSKQKQ